MKRWPIFALVLLLACAAGTAHAEENKDDWIKGKLFLPELILKNQKKLGLTDKQRNQLGLEITRVQAQAAQADWEIMNSGLQVQELIEKHPVDGKASLALIDKVLEAENRKKRLYVEMLINVKNLLTPEQVQMLKAMTQ